MTSTMLVEKQVISMSSMPLVPLVITEEAWEEECKFLREVQPQNHDHVY